MPVTPVQPTPSVFTPTTESPRPPGDALNGSALERQGAVRPSSVAPLGSAVGSELAGAVRAVVGLADNKTVELTPNDLGLFPRVLLGKEQTVPISLTYSAAEPGEVLVISAEDGGQVNSSIPVQTVKLDENRQVNFRFTTTQNEGVFRVTLRRAAEQQQFDFWVGPEPVVQTTTPSF